MSRRTLVLLVALVLAGVAALAIWQYLNSVETTARAGITEVQVWRATANIETGTDGAVAVERINVSTALRDTVVFEGSSILCGGPADATTSDVDFTVCDGLPSDINALLANGVSAGPISRGQLITSEMFVLPSELDLDTLSAQIPLGKVAMAISPGDVASVGGFVRPGDHINVVASFTLNVAAVNELLANPDTRDILLDGTVLPNLLTTATPTPPQFDAEGNLIQNSNEPQDGLSQYANALPETVEFTQTILQDLVVLAVGADTIDAPGVPGADPTVEAAIVLELTAPQAEILEFARQRAALSISLLPAGQPYTQYASPGVTVDDIFQYLDRLRDELGALGG